MKLWLKSILALAAVLALSIASGAQQSSASKLSGSAGADEFQPSIGDIFAGYSFIDPLSRTNGVQLDPIYAGALENVTYYFNRHWGLQVESGFHGGGSNDCIYSAGAGPVYRFPLSGALQPFVHVVGGAVKVGGPDFQPCTWGPGFAAGGGLDWGLHVFQDRLAIRLLQSDFEYAHVNYGAVGAFGLTGGTLNMHAVRASAGLVLRLGSLAPPVPVGLTCTAQPSDVFPGDPIQVSATTANVSLRNVPRWSWSTTGGVLSGTSQTVSVNTRGVKPGQYRVTGHISVGAKPWESAECNVNFTVKQFPAPTLSCKVEPNTVEPGEKADVIAHGESSSNRPLTYSFSPSAGSIIGKGSVVVLDTAGVLASGVQKQDVNIDCATSDDLGQTAHAAATLHVVSPPPLTKAGAPPTRSLCSITFDRDAKRPTRVDNTAKACLDDVALSLNQQADARLVIIGESGAKERNGERLAAERAIDARKYLVRSRDIDPQRIELLTNEGKGQQLENVLVPLGATFDRTGTKPVDESRFVVPATRKPLAKTKATEDSH